METSPTSLKDVGVGSGSVRSRRVGTRTSTVKTKDAMTEPLPVIMVSVVINIGYILFTRFLCVYRIPRKQHSNRVRSTRFLWFPRDSIHT